MKLRGAERIPRGLRRKCGLLYAAGCGARRTTGMETLRTPFSYPALILARSAPTGKRNVSLKVPYLQHKHQKTCAQTDVVTYGDTNNTLHRASELDTKTANIPAGAQAEKILQRLHTLAAQLAAHGSHLSVRRQPHASHRQGVVVA